MKKVIVLWVYLTYPGKEICQQAAWDVGDHGSQKKWKWLAEKVLDAMDAWFEHQISLHGPGGKKEYQFAEYVMTEDLAGDLLSDVKDMPSDSRHRFADHRVQLVRMGGSSGQG